MTIRFTSRRESQIRSAYRGIIPVCYSEQGMVKMFSVIQNVLKLAALVLGLIACWKAAGGKIVTGYIILGVAFVFFALSIISIN